MTQARSYEGRTSVNSVWVDQLRALCLTLVEKPSAVSAMSVSKGFANGREVERDAVIVLAQRMAEEYGLQADTELRGYYLTIRISRSPEPATTVATPAGSSLFRWVRGVFGSHGSTPAAEEQEAEAELGESVTDITSKAYAPREVNS